MKHNPPDKEKEMLRARFLEDAGEIRHDLRSLQNSDLSLPKNMKDIDNLEQRVLEILDRVRKLRVDYKDNI